MARPLPRFAPKNTAVPAVPTRLAPLACTLGVLLAACGDDVRGPAAAPLAEAGPAPDLPRIRLTVGAFSAMSEAIGVRVLPEFAHHWRRARRQQVDFVQRFEGSGALADSIAAGFEADVVLFALTPDLEQLERAGLVDPTWRNGPHRGIVCRSVIALAVRKGNPKGIRDWSDLVRPGIGIVCPDPGSSGCGVWSACAIYGAAWRGHAGVPAGDADGARRFLAQVWANVVTSDGSAASSYKTFQAGTGDVAITYESEIAKSWLFGHADERVIPTSTLLVESPAAVVGTHAERHGVRAAAESFLQFLWTPAVQRKLASCGLRPVDEEVRAASRGQFPEPADQWTIDDLGGWERVAREVLVPAGFVAPARPIR